jgi:hypothetical protein
MSPPRASSADPQQTAHQIAAVIEEFLAAHAQAAVLEDGKVVFDLATAQHSLSTEHDRCTLHLWSEQRNLVRRIVSADVRAGTLRLATQRFGHAQTKLLELVADRARRTPTAREAARAEYLKLLEGALARHFGPWKPEGLRSAMDLENSFGPAFARGSLVRGNQAWAVIGVGEQEDAATIDGVLTVGILWLHACRERASGKRLYQGLKVVVPRGAAGLTPSRLEWLNTDAAQWELWEFDQRTAELTACDATGYGNLRTRLIHHPDEQAAAVRFAAATAQVMELVPATERHRVETRLRSNAELVFLVHGLEFARAQVVLAPNSFAQRVELSVGAGAAETPLTAENQLELAERIAELFSRRRAVEGTRLFAPRNAAGPARRIGHPSTAPAHARQRARGAVGQAASDPLYRAAPERWLESMLRKDLAPLTRSLAPAPQSAGPRSGDIADDPDSLGNRADPAPPAADADGNTLDQPADTSTVPESRAIPRLDPRHVYAQVPAIAGASDRGLLDLLGVTADGRLAVIELKASEDLHFALQGLDYWVRVRHHHLQPANGPAPTGPSPLQQHGYFRDVELAPLPPRLYLVAPALHIHPATETVLRYLSPRVEWHLLALDERWRSQVRVVWRKHGGTGSVRP